MFIIDIFIFFIGIRLILDVFYGWGYLGSDLEIEYSLPVSPFYYPVLIGFMAVAVISYIVLSVGKTKVSLPLVLLCTGGVISRVLFSLLWCIQIASRIELQFIPQLAIFQLSFIVCSARLIGNTAFVITDRLKAEANTVSFWKKAAVKPMGFLTLSFAAAAILIVISIPVTLAFSFPADSILKIFTGTNDWTFSKGLW